MKVIDSYIEGKYGSDSAPDSDRFKDELGEYHASQVSNCPRKWFWKFKDPKDNDPSVYFELGRVFETIYGRALRWQFGDARVRQDVGIEIHVDDEITIVGESDWTVFKEGMPQVEKVILHEDGSRTCILPNGDEREYNNEVERVIETKTTKDVNWKLKYGYSKGHHYQLQTYMWAMNAPGLIAYMSRNELDEVIFDFERDDFMEADMEIRTRRQHQNLKDDEVPETDPMNEQECKYCNWREECKALGGEVWD